MFVFFFKQKTAYEMRISDWSSDVCSSDLNVRDVPMSIDVIGGEKLVNQGIEDVQRLAESLPSLVVGDQDGTFGGVNLSIRGVGSNSGEPAAGYYVDEIYIANPGGFVSQFIDVDRVEVLNGPRSEETTSEL